MEKETVAQEVTWQSVVYGGAKSPQRDFFSREWRSIRWRALLRDGFKCQRCGKFFPHGRRLTVHHILPYAQGGNDALANLISLCDDCHNKVEWAEFPLRAAIVYDPINESVLEKKPREIVSWAYTGKPGKCWVDGRLYVEYGSAGEVLRYFFDNIRGYDGEIARAPEGRSGDAVLAYLLAYIGCYSKKDESSREGTVY